MKEDKSLEQILNEFRSRLKEDQGTPWYSKIGKIFKKRPYLSTVVAILAGMGGLFGGKEIYSHFQVVNKYKQAAKTIKEAREDINQSIADAVARTAGKHAGFEYSLIIYAKNKSGKTISYGESASEHENGNLSIKGITEEQIKEIIGEKNYQHLQENTDTGFSPIREGRNVDMEEAQEWTEITDMSAAKALGKYCRQLGNDLVYLTDNKPETGTFWKLKIRRHKKDER